MKLLELFLVEYKRDITIQKLGDRLAPVAERDRKSSVEDVLIAFEQADPTKNKQYVEWICRQYINQMFKVEDTPRIRTVLTQFENAKRTNQPVERDINRYDFRTLQDAMDKIFNTEVKGEKQEGMFPVVEGTKVIYNGPLGQFAIPYTEDAAKELGKKTKWCTAWEEDNRFDVYHETGRIFTWRGVDGSRYQFHYDSENWDISAMNGKDQPISPEVLQYLRTQHPVLSEFFKNVFEPMIAKHPWPSIQYAVHYLHGPFPAGEPAIIEAGDDKIEQYMRDALKGKRFLLYEDNILNYWNRTSVSKAANYMTLSNMDRWPELEDKIIERKDAVGAYRYANYTLKRRWPEAESVIKLDPWTATSYCIDMLDADSWPEAEPYIMRDPRSAVEYAIYVKNGRWPEAEDTIATAADSSLSYARSIINGRWKKGEAVMKSNEHIWEVYNQFLWDKDKSVPQD